jgi:hypothetical protein
MYTRRGMRKLTVGAPVAQAMERVSSHTYLVRWGSQVHWPLISQTDRSNELRLVP